MKSKALQIESTLPLSYISSHGRGYNVMRTIFILDLSLRHFFVLISDHLGGDLTNVSLQMVSLTRITKKEIAKLPLFPMGI